MKQCIEFNNNINMNIDICYMQMIQLISSLTLSSSLLLIIILIVLYILLKMIINYINDNKIPRVKGGMPFFGQVFEMIKGSPWDTMTLWVYNK